MNPEKPEHTTQADRWEQVRNRLLDTLASTIHAFGVADRQLQSAGDDRAKIMAKNVTVNQALHRQILALTNPFPRPVEQIPGQQEVPL